MPDEPLPVEVIITKDIVRVDHRSLRMLGATPDRGEVYRLLLNVIGFLQIRESDAARALLDHAEAVYHQHIQAKNRLRYLGGMLAGIMALLGFGFLLSSLLNSPGAVIPLSLVPLILLFAGMGSITSVLTRLSSIDLRDQASVWMIYISGMARPVTGLFFALVIYLVLALRIVDFHLGAGTEPTPPALFLIAAFMSGFSERFAQDILTKLGGTISASEPEKRLPSPEPSEAHKPLKESPAKD